MSADSRIVLASASPRRVELLALAGVDCRVIPADIVEDALEREQAADHVERLSREKAAAVAARADGRFFIGADTVVVLDGAILGKPSDKEEARRMLRSLSGRDHQVISGFTVLDREAGCAITRSVSTQVRFKPLDAAEIEAYVASGCPMDKAGAYAIQGGAGHFVTSISGSFTNVVGLPMSEVYDALKEIGAI